MLAADTDLKGTLYLDLKIHHVLFNQKGKYNVKFSIRGSRGDLRKVRLYLNGSKQSIFEYEYTSEPWYQDGVDHPCQLDDNQFRFEMPEGKKHKLNQMNNQGMDCFEYQLDLNESTNVWSCVRVGLTNTLA